MKNRLRYLVFFVLLLVMGFGTSVSTRSSAARPDNAPDLACIDECRLQLELCLTAGGKKGNGCISVYKTCINHCGR